MASNKKVAKKKRTRNPVETRAKLLQATIDLVTEKGPDALSLKEAARRANVSRGVAYLHFDDRDQLLNDAKALIAERLQEGVKSFDRNASLHDRTLYTTRLVLDHPDASQSMIASAMAGRDLDRQHPLYKFVLNMLKELRASGKARPDIDLEILTYIMFGSIASTVMLGQQRKGEDIGDLAERFTNEWNRILLDGIFTKASEHKARRAGPARTQRASSKTGTRRNAKS
jgi:AcrR family transcriptional regulator